MSSYHSEILSSARVSYQHIKQQAPIIHNITNYVSAPIVANILLAIGASPVMAHELQEMSAITTLANALVLNIGTLDKETLAAMQLAQAQALKQQIPIILDPVGVGASDFRKHAALSLLSNGVDIIRGNASEIMALANADESARAVAIDALDSSQSAVVPAQQLARMHQCVVMISGPTDYVINATDVVAMSYGDSLFTRVTGMGCSLTAVIACFAAIIADYTQAAIEAALFYSLVGQQVAAIANGPASFQQRFVDSLYAPSFSELNALVES